jgi:hypothetical protein
MWIYAKNEHVYGTKDVQICSTIYTLAKDCINLYIKLQQIQIKISRFWQQYLILFELTF